MNIDPNTANFNDVSRVLKVLDDYALKKLAAFEDEPLLPEIIRIQRAIRGYLAKTRLKRCVRDGIRFIHGMKAMQKFELRAQRQQFIYQYELSFREAIEQSTRKRLKKEER